MNGRLALLIFSLSSVPILVPNFAFADAESELEQEFLENQNARRHNWDRAEELRIQKKENAALQETSQDLKAQSAASRKEIKEERIRLEKEKLQLLKEKKRLIRENQAQSRSLKEGNAELAATQAEIENLSKDILVLQEKNQELSLELELQTQKRKDLADQRKGKRVLRRSEQNLFSNRQKILENSIVQTKKESKNRKPSAIKDSGKKGSTKVDLKVKKK